MNFRKKKKGRKRKQKKPLSVGIPSRADYTVWHQNSSQNFTSQLDKTLNKLRKNKVMRKTKENTNTLPLQRLKKRTNVKMSKGQLDCARRHRPKTNITNPSASMSYWSAQICCHTHLLFSSQKLQKKKKHKLYVSDGCAIQTAQYKLQPMQVTHRAWQ